MYLSENRSDISLSRREQDLTCGPVLHVKRVVCHDGLVRSFKLTEELPERVVGREGHSPQLLVDIS
jgi:hypothetical protein